MLQLFSLCLLVAFCSVFSFSAQSDNMPHFPNHRSVVLKSEDGVQQFTTESAHQQIRLNHGAESTMEVARYSIDADGCCIVVGRFSGDLYLGERLIAFSEGLSLFILKISQEGELAWQLYPRLDEVQYFHYVFPDDDLQVMGTPTRIDLIQGSGVAKGSLPQTIGQTCGSTQGSDDTGNTGDGTGP